MPELVCFRAADYRTPLRIRAHGPRGGRFHRPFSPPTQYLSLHPLGPWAEVVRGRGLVEEADAMQLRLSIWALRLELPDPPYALDFDAAVSDAAPAPIAPADLIDDDHAACRRFADVLRGDPTAPKILTVPSAALPGTRNLVILGPRRTIEYAAHVKRPTQVPAALIAVRAQPLATMLPHVRHIGRPHEGYEAWRNGTESHLPALGLDV